jgi:hypothetical protein
MKIVRFDFLANSNPFARAPIPVKNTSTWIDAKKQANEIVSMPQKKTFFELKGYQDCNSLKTEMDVLSNFPGFYVGM